jgi:hypothetical protein
VNFCWYRAARRGASDEVQVPAHGAAGFGGLGLAMLISASLNNKYLFSMKTYFDHSI